MQAVLHIAVYLGCFPHTKSPQLSAESSSMTRQQCFKTCSAK